MYDITYENGYLAKYSKKKLWFEEVGKNTYTLKCSIQSLIDFGRIGVNKDGIYCFDVLGAPMILVGQYMIGQNVVDRIFYKEGKIMFHVAKKEENREEGKEAQS